MTTPAQFRALTAKEFKSLGLAKMGSSWVVEADDLYWVVGLVPIAHARFAGFEVGVQFKVESELAEKPEPYLCTLHIISPEQLAADNGFPLESANRVLGLQTNIPDDERRQKVTQYLKDLVSFFETMPTLAAFKSRFDAGDFKSVLLIKRSREFLESLS